MKGFRYTGAITALLIATLMPSPAFAFNELFLAKGPLGKLKKDDVEIARKEIRTALESGDDGHTYTWSNPKTNASGTLTPTKTYTTKGMRCRAMDLTAYVGGERGSSKLNLCKTDKGWKVV